MDNTDFIASMEMLSTPNKPQNLPFTSQQLPVTVTPNSQFVTSTQSQPVPRTPLSTIPQNQQTPILGNFFCSNKFTNFHFPGSQLSIQTQSAMPQFIGNIYLMVTH